MTLKRRHLTGSHLEVAREGRKLAYTVYFTSYKAVVRRRKSHERKGHHLLQVTGSNPEVKSFDRKSFGSGGKMQKLMYTVYFTSYKAVARRRRQSCYR